MFIINSLDPGGAENVASLLVNSFVRSHEVLLITRKPSDTFFYKIDPRIQIKTFQGSARGHVKFLTDQFREFSPDLTISFMTETNLLALMAWLASGKRGKLKVAERTDPRMHKLPVHIRFLRKSLYHFADALVVQTEGLRTWGETVTSPNRISVIPNPINFRDFSAKSVPDFQPEIENYLLSVGRLTFEKGHDLLIRAFFLLNEKYPDLSLLIIGNGPEKENLENLISTHVAGKKIKMVPKRSNLIDYLRGSRLFVLHSRYEGYPNVLLEALATGVPSISFNCQSGPADLLKGKLKEYLVEEMTPEALARKIAFAIEKADKKLFEENAVAIQKNNHIDKISSIWLGN